MSEIRSTKELAAECRVHVREVWLWQNPEAMASVDRGLAQMARGETVDLGSFAQYANLEID